MATAKNGTKNHSSNISLILSVVALVWLLALTIFSVFAWNQHMWQAKVDNEAIHRNSVKIVENENAIEALRSK